MFARLIALLACLSLMPLAASAQFGPKPPTPYSPEELYADRLYNEGGRLSSGVPGNVVTDDSGLDFERAQDRFDESRGLYQTLCDSTEAEQDQWARNCHKVADMYRRGIGVSQDYRLARNLYDRSCLQGDHIVACTQQAYLSHLGRGARRSDMEHARELYDHACGLKDPRGCAGLGNMLYRGQGGDLDRTRGSRLLQQSCASDYDWACERLKGFGIPETLERF